MVHTGEQNAGSPMRSEWRAGIQQRTRGALLLLCSGVLAGATACDGGSTGPGNHADPRIRWVVTVAPGIYYGSPALSADEQTIYVGTSIGVMGSPATTHSFKALSASNGATLWSFPLGAREVRSSPAVALDASITFVAGDTVFRLTAAGTLVWRQGIRPDQVMPVDVGASTPAVAPDGSAYVALGGLYAIDASGAIRWRRFESNPEEFRAAPVVGDNGTVVYFAAHNVPLTALDPSDGHTVWSLPLGVNDHVLASPALGADGSIYVATNGCELYAVSPSGTLRWMFAASSAGFTCEMRSSPAIGSDGTIYLGTTHGNPASVVFAIRPNGTLKWTFTPTDLPPGVPADHFDIYSSPAIGSDGTIHVGHEFGRVHALDPATGAERWRVETRSGITWSSPALGAAGWLVISDLQGNVYSITTDSHGLQAGAPWPRFRRSNQGRGS